MTENHQLSQFISLSFQNSALYCSYYFRFFLYCYFIISDYIWAVNVWGWSCLWQWKVSQKRLRITIWEILVILWHKILVTGFEEHDIISDFDMIHDIIRVTWDTLLWHDIAKIWQKLYLSITITRWSNSISILNKSSHFYLRSLLWRGELCRPRCTAHTPSWLLQSWARAWTQKGHWDRSNQNFN